PLEVVETPWSQWCVLLPREREDPRDGEARRVAARAVEQLGLETGGFHLEWFRRRDGSLAISEVGARPGGAQISKLLSYAHNRSFYDAWAELMIDDRFAMPERRYATGAAFLRAQGRGKTVARVRGLNAAQRELGALVVDKKLPRVGQPAASGYEGEGWVIVRHSSTEVVRKALGKLISSVRVELG
ncbi:MAG: hypothetical protein AAGN46_10130, partial [Acidobacteriota bacterium]